MDGPSLTNIFKSTGMQNLTRSYLSPDVIFHSVVCRQTNGSDSTAVCNSRKRARSNTDGQQTGSAFVSGRATFIPSSSIVASRPPYAAQVWPGYGYSVPSYHLQVGGIDRSDHHFLSQERIQLQCAGTIPTAYQVAGSTHSSTPSFTTPMQETQSLVGAVSQSIPSTHPFFVHLMKANAHNISVATATILFKPYNG